MNDVIPLSARCVQSHQGRVPGWGMRQLLFCVDDSGNLQCGRARECHSNQGVLWKSFEAIIASMSRKPSTRCGARPTLSEGGMPMHVGTDGGFIEADMDASWVVEYGKAQVRAFQEDVPDLGKVTKWLRAFNHRPSRDEVIAGSPATWHFWLLWDQVHLVDGVLHKRWESPQGGQETLELIVPRCLQVELLEQMHNSMIAGHLGVKKTASRRRRQYYWYGMKEAITLWVRKCAKYGARK